MISVEIIEWIPDNDPENPDALVEHTILSLNMPHAPRVGEELWFLPHGGHKPAIVTHVAYWVSERDYCKAAVYVEDRDKEEGG